MRSLRYGLAVAALASLACTVDANADTISIGFSTDLNGPVTSLTSSGTGSAAYVGPIGNFDVNIVSGSGSPPLVLPALLNSNSSNVSSATAGTVFIWVTESDIAAPATGIQPFMSALTSNTLSGGATLTLETFIDLANGIFTHPTSLGGPVSFTSGPLTATAQTDVALTGGLYSVTAMYEVTTVGAGSANATIDVAVPGPLVGAGLPGLFAACCGLVALARRRRRQVQ